MSLPTGIHQASKCPFQFPVLDRAVPEGAQPFMALGRWFSFDAPCVSFLFFLMPPFRSVLYVAELASEVTAAFQTTSSSCQREVWEILWQSPSPTLSLRGLPFSEFSFPLLLQIWSFKHEMSVNLLLFFSSPPPGLDSKELFPRGILQAPVHIYKGELFLLATAFWMHSVYARRRRLYWEHSEFEGSGTKGEVNLWILFWNLSYFSSLRHRPWEPWELILSDCRTS